MFPSSVIVLSLLGLLSGFTVKNSNGLEIRDKRSVHYHGPLAPINQGGTVSLTPEVQRAKLDHQAAIEAELHRLKEAARLAAAHPDLTSPKQGYVSSSKYNQVISQQYLPQPQLQASLNADGTGADIAQARNAAAAQKAAFAAEYKRRQQAERLAVAYPDFASTSYNKGNPNQVYFGYNQGNAYSYPQAYIPAPLNPDGTVALTPEVQQARAAHQAAFAAEFQRLDAAARLAAAYPDLTSPPKGYSSFNKGYYNQNNAQQVQYNPQALFFKVPMKYSYTLPTYANIQNAAAAELKRFQYAGNTATFPIPQGTYSSAKSVAQHQAYLGGHYANIPAPLNADGTVAHTAEYRAIAAAHQAEHAKALQRNKFHGYLSSSQQFHSNNHYGHY